MKKIWLAWLLLPFSGLGQTASCTQKGSLTTATTFTALPNNTANPNCNAWALTWSTVGFSAVSIQLQGSDDNVTYAAFTGATTVLVGSNPSSALSGATIIQASTKNAYVQVRLVSATGSGAVNFQIFGYNGVTPAAKGASGGGGVNWSAVLAGTNSQGFLQVHSPTILEPTATSGGGIYATQMVDGNDLPAVQIGTPGGPAIDYVRISTQVSSATPVQIAAFGADSNINLELLSKGTGVVYFGSTAAFVDSAGNLTVTSCTGCPTGTVTGVTASSPLASSGGPAPNISIPSTSGTGSTVLLQGSPSITTPTIADFTNAGHTHANAAGGGQLDNTAVKTANKAGAGTLFAMAASLGTSGNCANWNSNGIGDSGSPCPGGGGTGGGGVVTYSGPTLSILAGTSFCPIGGGGSCSATETNVDIDSSATATVAKMYVQLSTALGAGNSVVVTWRDNAASQTVTCTISGASATSCNDTTHSFTATTGDLLDYQLVFTGTIVATPTITVMSAFGTSNVGVTSVFGNSGPTVGATGDIGATGQVLGVKGVPLCTGFTPTNGQNLQYTTASSPNPCYTAATAAVANSFPLTVVQETTFNSGSGGSTSYTFTLPFAAASSGNTLFLMVATDGGQAFTVPTGWTADLNQAQTAYSRFVLLHKASASDTTVVFAAGGSSFWAGYFMEVSGSHALDQSAIAGQAITTGQYLFTAITPAANSVVFALIALTNSTLVNSEPYFSNPINPAWRPLFSSNSVNNGGRYLTGFVSAVAATNVSTRPPPIWVSITNLAGSGAVVTTFSIL